MVKKKHALALFPLALCFSSAHVLAAATTADLEKRLQDQEKKITRLENQLKGTRSAVKENRGRIADMGERLKINGFLSAGVAVNDGDAIEDTVYGISDEYSTSAINKLGIQMTFKVADNIDATAQLVSRGTKDYNIEAEWAYLSYKVNNNLKVDFGRQRIPYYLLSEYLDVGYALPWVYAPIELYNIPITSTDGISATYNFNAGPVNFAWQTYGGASSGFTNQLDATFKQKESWGTSLVAEVSDWTFRVGYNTSKLDADVNAGGAGDQLLEALDLATTSLGPTLGVPLPDEARWITDAENIRTEYMSAAFMYDNGSLLVMGEIANLDVDGTIQPVGDSGYLTVGYRFGKWMPHITYAKFQTDSDNDEQVRQMQDYANAIGQASYAAALGYNTAVNQVVTIGGTPLATAGVQANQVVEQKTCSAAAVACSSNDALVLMGLRDQLLSAADGLGSNLYNITEAQIQEQQSVTIGLTYDVTPRVKAKVQATHYEGFGSNGYQYLGSSSGAAVGGALPVINYSGFSTQKTDGNGRFSGEPGAAGNHTAIYSFSIDAVF